MSTELTHLAAFCNSEIYCMVEPLLDDFPWKTDVAKALNTSTQMRLHDKNPAVIRSILTDVLMEEEIDSFLQIAGDFRSVEADDDILSISENIFSYYQRRKLDEILQEADGDDMSTVINEIQEIPSEITSPITIHNMGNQDAQKMMDDIKEIGSIPSNFALIRDATPFNGYLFGQVIQFVAAPGVGKSAIMLQEAILAAIHGYKVLWVAMGDLSIYDFTCRGTSLLAQQDFFEVSVDLATYYTDKIKEVMGRIDLISAPSRSLSVEQIKARIDRDELDYDLLVFDYDSNFIQSQTGNMYEDGGAMYDTLTGIARPSDERKKRKNDRDRVIFVGCQPKSHYWQEEMLDEGASGESARKQHAIDMMVTLGVRHHPEAKCGLMHLPKVRRGKANGVVPYRMNNFGRFSELSKEEYAMLKSYDSK